MKLGQCEMMFKYHKRLILILFLLFLLPGCARAKSTNNPAMATALPTRTQFTVPTSTITLTSTPTLIPTSTQTPTYTPAASLQLSGSYMGQIPPGLQAEIFAPGIVSDPVSSEFSGVFSPDGSEYYFYRFSESSQSTLLSSRVVNGIWTTPEPLTFTAGDAAYEPYIGFDNKRLYFAWNHATPTGQSMLPAYFFVERVPGGWSEPEYAGQGMFLSSSRDGQFYTTDMSSRNVDGNTYLAKITIEDGVFTNYERLSIQAHWGHQAHPCIAPDGSYILFDVESGKHLFVSFLEADGSWGDAIDLTNHGFDPMAGGAYISPDGYYLFFSLRGDIWWVDIGVIENLRTDE
jgi:hypothetical protein